MSESNFSSVFITGGTGFVGSYIVPHLTEDGRAVRCLVRDLSTLPHEPEPDKSLELVGPVDYVEG
ncbi:MAG: NAD-dependent epimerase/dehydratase family protein, partial [Rhodothermia bacterium]